MKKILFALGVGLALLTGAAVAQTVVSQPTYINPGTVTDFGNGPIELRITQGTFYELFPDVPAIPAEIA